MSAQIHRLGESEQKNQALQRELEEIRRRAEGAFAERNAEFDKSAGLITKISNLEGQLD